MRHTQAKLMLMIAMFLAATAGIAQGQSPVDGAWQITKEVKVRDGETTTIKNPQPSLYILRDGHYSATRVMGDESRPLMGEGANRSTITDEQVRAIFTPYLSNSGVFELHGDSLTVRPIVALWPDFMEGGFQACRRRTLPNLSGRIWSGVDHGHGPDA